MVMQYESKATYWKLFTVLSMLRSTSGNFLGTPTITTSLGTPKSNMALQLKPLFLHRPFTATLAELNNLGVPKHKDEEDLTLIAPLITEL